jgi:sigma-B regulation protein RsbU (phosphoserine phosphatase)
MKRMSNQGKKKKKRRSIRSRLFHSILLLGVLMIIGASVAIYVRDSAEVIQDYKRIAFSYTRTAAEFIDGDKVKEYIETGVEDDYYWEVQRYLKTTQEQSEIIYFHVFVPCEKDMFYIWDTDDRYKADEKMLGYRGAYMAGEEKASKSVLRQNPPENIIRSEEYGYGSVWSAYSPIFDSQGNPVAVAAVNLSFGSMEYKKAS